MKADLHMHSIYSDGQASPAQIMSLAKQAGISLVSLTDHDTVDGVDEAMQAAKALGQTNIPAIEISSFDGTEVHILGYNIDYKDANFCKQLQNLKAYRTRRNLEIIDKLNKIGYVIDYNDTQKLSYGSVGRAHIARCLIAKGYFDSFAQAYSLMREGAKCYVEHYELCPERAIQIIEQAGGIPVLAHPGRLKIPAVERMEFLKKLYNYGLKGIETHYKTHTKAVVKQWSRLGAELGLFNSIGGDNHTKNCDGFYALEPEQTLLDALNIRL